MKEARTYYVNLQSHLMMLKSQVSQSIFNATERDIVEKAIMDLYSLISIQIKELDTYEH